MRRWPTVLVCLSALTSVALIAVGAASAAKPTPLKGIYGTVIKSSSTALNGTWLINFVADGTYVVVKEPKSKSLLIGGSSTASGDKVTFVDKAGPLRCTGSGATGTYSWKLTGKTLEFTKVRDTCTGRSLIIGRSSWTKLG